MDIMVRPNKEKLIFFDKIIVFVERIIPGNIPKVIFKKDTPKDILELFNEIKNKISYELA